MLRLAALAAALLAAPALAAAPGAASEAGQGYALDTAPSTAAAKIGDAGKLVVVIRPKAPVWHVHPQAPLKVRFEAPAGLRLERSELGRKDAVDPKAEEPRFEAPFVAASAGVHEAKALVEFFICSDSACVKQSRTVPIAVSVK